MGRERGPSEDLAKLSEVVANWRAEGGGGRGTKIPEELWNEAVRVARSDGVWLTAKATRFRYDAIKQRLARADGGVIEPARVSARRGHRRARHARTKRRVSSSGRAARRQKEFVELSAVEILGAPSTMGTVVEVEDKAGVRMIVRLAKETQVEDVARLISAFRRRGG